jgi:hypothetical protein
VGDHLAKEEKHLVVSALWKGIGGDGGSKCSEELQQLRHRRGQEAKGGARVADEEKTKEWGEERGRGGDGACFEPNVRRWGMGWRGGTTR